MDVLEILKRALKACAEVIRFGAGIQAKARTELQEDLTAICENCQKAYDTVITALVPVKDAFGRPTELADALRSFAADASTRSSFKPEHLCGEVDNLISRLRNNLDPLKYAIDYRRIDALRQELSNFGNYDAAIYASYDEFTSRLDDLATQIQDPQEDADERASYARHVISSFEADLRSALAGVRDAKDLVVQSTM